jgi:hypothetical protein
MDRFQARFTEVEGIEVAVVRDGVVSDRRMIVVEGLGAVEKDVFLRFFAPVEAKTAADPEIEQLRADARAKWLVGLSKASL